MASKQSVDRFAGHPVLARLDDHAVVLHDRGVPNVRGHIDHVVVAPSGVWIVDVPRAAGRVTRRDIGSGGVYDPRLVVDGVDCTSIVDDLAWQVHAVRAMLDRLGRDAVPVTAVLVFPPAQWARFVNPFEVKGVNVMWPKMLAELVNEAGPLGTDTIASIVREFERLPTQER